MVPWWRMYDVGRPCTEPWIEKKLQRDDPRLHIRWHRYKRCWCVTRTKAKPGRVDEDLVLVWREQDGTPKPLSERIVVEVRSMDTTRWPEAAHPAEAVRIRERRREDTRDRLMRKRLWAHSIEAGRALAHLSAGRVLVRRP